MIDELVVCCGSLRVAFFRRSDRYRHVISVVQDGCTVELLESVEGGPDDAWPPSPVFQSLESTPRPEGETALLVGLAGKSHWSAAVLADRKENRERVTFDVACRIHRPPENLGSRYRLADGVSYQPTTGELHTPAGVFRLEPDATHASLAVLEHNDRVIEISAAAVDRPLPTTLRWKYAIVRLQGDSLLQAGKT